MSFKFKKKKVPDKISRQWNKSGTARMQGSKAPRS